MNTFAGKQAKKLSPKQSRAKHSIPNQNHMAVPVDVTDPASWSPETIIQMQRVYGNQQVMRLLSTKKSNTQQAIVQREPADSATLGDYFSSVDLPTSQNDDLLDKFNQQVIYQRLVKAKLNFHKNLRIITDPDEIKDLKAGYSTVLDSIRDSATIYLGYSEDAKRKVQKREQDRYEINMQFWAQEHRVAGGDTDHEAIRGIVEKLIAAEKYNAALAVIVDGYNMDKTNIVEIARKRFPREPNLLGKTMFKQDGIHVYITPKTFASSHEQLVHVVAHELEHARNVQEGVTDEATTEFLAEAVEIISKDMLEENILEFYLDAADALEQWNNMPKIWQFIYWDRFREVRNKVIQRIEDDFLAPTIPRYEKLMDDYRAVKPPVPGMVEP